jgi:hypothetical protein
MKILEFVYVSSSEVNDQFGHDLIALSQIKIGDFNKKFGIRIDAPDNKGEARAAKHILEQRAMNRALRFMGAA